MRTAREWTAVTGIDQTLLESIQREVLESAARECDLTAESYEDRSSIHVDCARDLARVIRGMKP